MKSAKLTASLLTLIAAMALSNFVVKAPAQQRIPKCRATADQIYFVDNGQSIKELHPGSDGGYGYQLNILGSGVDKFTVVAEPYMKTVSLVYKNDTQAKWQIYFQLWLPAQKTIASEGWGGDRVKVTKNAAGQMTAWIATVWDTQKDADELVAAYVGSLAKRFPKGSGDPKTDAGFDRGDGAGKIWLKQDGSKVFVVDGAGTAKSVADLAAATKIN